MTYKAILVHAEADAACEARLQLAADIANQFDAALIGIGAELLEPPTAVSAFGCLDGEVLVAEAESVRDGLAKAEERFCAAALTVGGGSAWRCAVSLPDDLLAYHSRAADLIVAGPRRPESVGLHSRADPGELLMRCGRPILLAPERSTELDASSVVVAWKDTREARRSLTDALPILKRARRVMVASICTEEMDAKDARRGLEDLCEHLGRHGVTAEANAYLRGQGSTAHRLLDIAKVQEAGLIVAGGFGHSRFSQWMFGGVTHELLTGARKAILMSH